MHLYTIVNLHFFVLDLLITAAQNNKARSLIVLVIAMIDCSLISLIKSTNSPYAAIYDVSPWQQEKLLCNGSQ